MREGGRERERPTPPEVSSLIESCRFAYYCEDGTRVSGFACQWPAECPDLSDECDGFEKYGWDWFVCDGRIVEPTELCKQPTCQFVEDVRVCVPDKPDEYVCANGATVSVEVVCDRASDARMGRTKLTAYVSPTPGGADSGRS